MKKVFLFVILFTFLFSCMSQRKKLDSWMGATKQKLYLSWGPPARTTDDGNGGEILIYAHQVYVPEWHMHYWDYKMMYVDQDGKIYHWRTSRQDIPPTEVDVRFLN